MVNWTRRHRIHDVPTSSVPRDRNNTNTNKREQPTGDRRLRRRRGVGKNEDDSSENSSSSTFKIHDNDNPSGTILKERETASTTTDEEVDSNVKAAAETTAKIKDKSHKQLRFDTVQIRTYPMVLGDNPYLSMPLSIGWRYHEEEPETVECYDEKHHTNNPQYVFAQYQKPLTIEERRAVLRKQGLSDEKIREEECRRRVQIAMEWSFRFDHPDKDIPCTIPNAERYIERYVK